MNCTSEGLLPSEELTLRLSSSLKVAKFGFDEAACILEGVCSRNSSTRLEIVEVALE